MDEFFADLIEILRNLWLQVNEQVGLILFALISFLAGIYVARISQTLVRRGLRYRQADPEFSLLVGRITKWAIIVFALLFATQQLGVDITAFLTGIGILGFTIGFALQDVSKNFIAGILILLQQPFHLGDKIEVSGFIGSVLDITLRDSVLLTDDGLRVRIPNGDIFTQPVLNYSRLQRRRVQINVGVSYDSDLEKVRKVAAHAVDAVPGLLADPPAELAFESFGEYAIQLRVFYWYDESQTTYSRALDAGIAGLKAAFDKAGIEIPCLFTK